MTNYSSLSLELRQQILFEAFAQADQDDLTSYAAFPRLKTCPWIAARVYQLGAVRISGDSASPDYKRAQLLCYSPAVSSLIDSLLHLDKHMRADLKFVVNKWSVTIKPSRFRCVLSLISGCYRADDKKETNRNLLASWTAKTSLPFSWEAWAAGRVPPSSKRLLREMQKWSMKFGIGT